MPSVCLVCGRTSPCNDKHCALQEQKNQANRLKQDATAEQLQAILRYMTPKS